MSSTKPLADAASGTIELRDLHKSYDDTRVLEGIDLRIEPGEFLVLVGPSGCGKSTLLRCVAGLEEVTSGGLFIDGRRCNDVHPKDRDLAMVFQSYALYPHMSVAENLAFSLTVRKFDRDEIDRRVQQVANRLGIADLLDRRSKQLSGGQRQRVAVGRAIVRDPTAFLFDEPLSNLDAALRARMRIELKKLHHDLDATMLYVTHDQVEAMTLADRIVVLDDGIIQQVGTPTELFERPANTFVAGFIGSPPMNFFDAQTTGDTRLESADVELVLPQEYSAVDLPESVIAGIRPTGMKLGAENLAVAGLLRATVEVVEPLGAGAYVHLVVDDTKAVAELPADQARELQFGDEIELSVAPEDVHVFDAQSGRVLRPGPREVADGTV